MGLFSDLAIDIAQREESQRVEWAVILDDPQRPAKLWRVLGEARGGVYLSDPENPGAGIFESCENVWIVA